MKKPRLFLVFALLLFFGLLIAHASENKPSSDQAQYKDLYEHLDLFTDALTVVEKSYVDDVRYKDLIYGALSGMLHSLDSHSQFLDQEEYQEMMVETEGEFGGLGIEITLKDKYLTVVTPLDGTPAAKAGLQPGDRLLKIDGVSTEDITLNQAVNKLRGKPGSKIVLTVSRPSKKEILEVTLKRDVIKIQSITERKMLDKAIGLVRIAQFQDRTTDEMDKAIKHLQAKGMKALVLDLRNNPGGLLQEAIDVSDRFLGEGKMIVYTKGRMPEQTVDFKGRTGPAIFNMPMVVLINDGSASGAEIVAGAMKDWKRAVVLGTKSFGKGSVQSVLPMKDGTALKLTTAKYFTPKGTSIHGTGIQPDITVEIPEQDQMRLMMSKVNRLDESDEKQAGEQPHDLQLDRAVDLLKGVGIFMQEKSPAAPSRPSK